jgi:hypothetical protein
MQLSTVLGSGLGPAIAVIIVRATGSGNPVPAYVAAGMLISAVGVYGLGRVRGPTSDVG